VIVIFICESSVLSEDKEKVIYTMFLLILIFICECSVRGDDRLKGIWTMSL
jgi:hypothetical protein